MNKKIKKLLIGGAMATAVAVPSSMFITQRDINTDLMEQNRQQKEHHELQQEQHEQEVNALLKQIDEHAVQIDGLTRRARELEQQKQDLEYVQQTIINNVGYFPTESERSLLERLVECEAGNESLTGKIAVANVVLNRIKSGKFPDTITDVIYQQNQFEPISSGVIYEKIPSQESKEAVKRAFMGERAVGSDILYFWASWLDKGNPIWQHIEIAATIGVHHFGRDWK